MRGITNLTLDCLGYDPDVILRKITTQVTTLWVSLTPTTMPCGWPLSFRRTETGIEVAVEWVEPNGDFSLLGENLCLSIFGSIKEDGDLSISRLIVGVP
jgi:hypothetical protein